MRRVGRSARPRAVDRQAIGMDGTRDVLDVLLADVLGAQHQLADDLLVDRAGDADAARGGNRFQPHGHVHGVAHEIVAVFHHVAQVDADAQRELIVGTGGGVGGSHRLLDFQRRPDGLHRAREFRQQPVAGHLEDPSAMLADQRACGVEARAEQPQRMFLVAGGHGAERHDVDGKDRRQSPDEVWVCHRISVPTPR
jgi:hypothetical protein